MKKVLSYLLTLMLVVSGSIIPNTGNSHAQATTASKEVESITLAEENMLETCSSTFSRNSLTDEEKNIYDALLSVLKDAYAGNVTVVNDEYVDSAYGTCIGKIEGGDTCTVQNTTPRYWLEISLYWHQIRLYVPIPAAMPIHKSNSYLYLNNNLLILTPSPLPIFTRRTFISFFEYSIKCSLALKTTI